MMSLNSVSEDIRQLLNNDGSFGIQGTDLFSFQWGVNSDGEEQNAQTIVIDTENLDVIDKQYYERPTFVIYVRGDTSESAHSVYDRARSIYQFMIIQVRQVINGTEYIQYEPVGSPRNLGKDNNNRFVYSMNFSTFRNSLGDS